MENVKYFFQNVRFLSLNAGMYNPTERTQMNQFRGEKLFLLTSFCRKYCKR